jgi:glycosyltransferase involved in cell wall biosynthesis
MRYAWHLRDAYFGGNRLTRFKARLAGWVLGRLRRWDRETAAGVTHFLAISRTVQQRIKECYGRESVVIYPPVDTSFYSPANVPRQDYYLLVSAFAPYKRLDLAIAACNRLRKRLVVIGTGQEEKRLRSLAGPTVEILGWQPDHVIREHYRRCRALLFPGEEDFGIVPLEAQACGAPVIAYERGGATETVVPMRSPGRSQPFPLGEPTGLLFEEQTVECLIDALEVFEARVGEVLPLTARRQAQRFNARRFAEEMFGFIAGVLKPETRETRRAA